MANNFNMDDIQKKAQELVRAKQSSAANQTAVTASSNRSTASSQKWYSGEVPTGRETLAQIYKVSGSDTQKRATLYNKYKVQTQDPTSVLYNPYTQATTTRQNTTNINNTNKALREWDDLSRELSFWATSSRNYSDDEIIANIDWKKYPTLAKMDAGRESGKPLALLTSVGYSNDAMHGVIWGARNPDQKSDNLELDAVKSVLGRGNTYKRDENIAQRLNKASSTYAPYTVGGTMDDLMVKYGTETFDDKWLADNAYMKLDRDMADDYATIYYANQNTKELQQMAEEWKTDVLRNIEKGVSLETIFDEEELASDHNKLYSLLESQRSGRLVNTTAAIDFDWEGMKKVAVDAYLKKNGTLSTTEYEQQMNDLTGGTHKQSDVDAEIENGWLLNTDILGKQEMTPAESRALKAKASTGYSDVVFTAADGVDNGTGGYAEMQRGLINEANALAGKNLLKTKGILDSLGSKDASAYFTPEVYSALQGMFPEIGKGLPTNEALLEKWKASEKTYDPASLMQEFENKTITADSDELTAKDLEGSVVGEFMQKYDPDKEKYTMQDVQHAFASYSQNPSASVLPWEVMSTELTNARVAQEQDAIELAAAQEQLADIEDAVAEAYGGKDTEQYRAFFATYDYAYKIVNQPDTFAEYDPFQMATMAEGFDTSKAGDYLLSYAGNAGSDVLKAQAALENAKKMGMGADAIAALEKDLAKKQKTLDLVNAHYLTANKDYSSQVQAFDKTFTAETITAWGGRHEQDVLTAVVSPELAQSTALRFSSDPYMSAQYSGLLECSELARAMTGEERSNYKYLYATKGEEAATEYFDALTDNLIVRKSVQDSEARQEWAGESAINSIIATGVSFALTPVAAVEGFVNAFSSIIGNDTNPFKDYTASMAQGDLRQGVKDGVAEAADNEIVSGIFNAVYDVVTSAGDTAAGPAVLALSVMNSSMMDARMRGADTKQALAYGVSNAVIEFMTEKLGMEHITNAFKKKGAGGVRELLGEMLSGFANEFGEETVGNIAGQLTDDLIMGNLSNYNNAVEQYVGIGLSEEAAKAQAARDSLKDILYGGLVGGLSGGLTSGIGFAAGSVAGKNTHTEAPQKPVEAPAEQTPPVYQGTEKERAVSALSAAQGEGVGEVKQQATVQGVLQGLGVSAQESSAAAKMIMDNAGMKMAQWLIAKSDNPQDVAKALTFAQLVPQSRSAAVLGTKVNSENANAVGRELLEAYKVDSADSKNVEQYEAAVHESALADAAVEILEKEGSEAIAKANRDKKEREQEKREKSRDFSKKNAAAESAANALKEASAAVAQDASPENIKRQSEAHKELQKAKSAREQARVAMEEANAKAKDAAEIEKNVVRNAQNSARMQAQQYVAQETEQRKAVEAEKAVKAEQERAAAQLKQQDDNIKALMAEDFVQTYYADAPSDTKQQLRERYVAYDDPTQQVTRENIEFATLMSKKFGFDVQFIDSHGIFEGAYTGGNTIVLDKNATQGEVIKRVLVHEITHAAENSKVYDKLADAVLEAYYGDNADQMQADLDVLATQYSQQAGQSGKAVARSELVAKRLGEMLSGNQEAMDRLVAEKPDVATRIWRAIRDFIKKLRGVNDPELDKIIRLEKMLENALTTRDHSKETAIRFSQQDSQRFNPENKTFDELLDEVLSDEEPSKEKYLSIGRFNDNFAALFREKGVDIADLPILMNYKDAYISIQSKENGRYKAEGINYHNLGRKGFKQAIKSLETPIAGMVSKKTGKIELVLPTVDQKGNSNLAVFELNTRALHGRMLEVHIMPTVYGRRSIDSYIEKASQENRLVFDTRKEAPQGTTQVQYEGSINGASDKSIAQPGVKVNLSIPTDSGEPAAAQGTRFSLLPSNDILDQRIAQHRNSQLAPAPNGMIPGGSVQEQQPHGDGERQFVVQTLPNNPNIPKWAVEGLLNNPNARYYEKDTNRDQLVRGWHRVQENGVQSEVERLLSLDTFTADDTAESNLLMAMALREDTADPATFFALAEKSAVVSTGTAQALQARKMISKMTPDGIKIWAAGQLEQGLREHMRTHQPQKQQVDEAAAQVADQISDMQSGDEVLRLNAGGDFTIDESNNRWGIPINEQQQALIDHYKLNKVARPGIFYNRATTKQRMLEAIIATPNPLEVTGLGLNLIQRLEFMQRGEAVITNADLNYMGTQLGQFVALGGEGGDRAADLALARAYEAFGNITPATRMEKFRTIRYVNMLTTIPSFARNIVGNMGQNVVNAAAHGIGVEIDRLASLKSGKRTMAHLSTAERIEGWKAFAEETKNTFLDFFVDKANTAPNRDKYNVNQRGRTFQSSGLEIAKDIESFLMSVGDRNVWKKAFVNSMAEQQKLADRNQLFNADGTTRTQEQMVEQAEADANYATFTEESLAQDVMNYLRSRNPVAADVISLYIPFTGVPHNIMKRNFQYSPFGFLTMAGRMAANKVQGRRFDQHAFVNDLSRALTGTGGVLAGVMLGLGGIIKMGTEDEEKDKVYDVETALGEQYTPYVYDPTTETYVSMSTFAPSASPLVWGASIGQMLQNDEFNASALISAMTSSVDSIFDASYLSGLSDLFGGYGSFAENLAHVTAENLSSQLTPAFLNQVANAMDPYVRDTKDKDYLIELMKTTMNRIPGLRNMLPEKVTVAGENVMTKQGWSLVDPFTRTNPSDNAALIEAKRLYDVTGSTNVLPSDALRGRKNEIKVDKKSVVLDDKQKEEYKKYYGQLWTSAVNELINSPTYQSMDDGERADQFEDIMSDALKQAKKEFIKRYGD